MYRIFISYRRSDSESFSGRLRDRLRGRFGRRCVFMDTSEIPSGARFEEVIMQTLGTCKVFIAVIGKTWLDCRDEQGNRRLDNPDDWIRRETVRALASDMLVIPVTFDGSSIPASKHLPADLQPLTGHNCTSIVNADFDRDVQEIIQACETRVQPLRRWPLFAGAAAALMAVMAGILHFIPRGPELHGIRIVPGSPFYSRLPLRVGGEGKRYYLSTEVAGGALEIVDLTRKLVYIGRELTDLDASSRQQDSDALREDIRRHFTVGAGGDVDAVAARLLDDPIFRQSIQINPGATVSVEFGELMPTPTEPEARNPLVRCKFVLPKRPAAIAPVFYLVGNSDECVPVH